MLEVTKSGGPFAFSDENLEKAKTIIAKYPEGRQRSAVMPLLYLAQAQNKGWVSREAIETIAEMLSMPKIQVLEVATFYTMYNLKPIGRHHVQLCGTTPCWLRGADEVMRACRDMGLEKGRTTEDGLFHLTEVECLGACANAPMVQINDAYFEDLDYESMTAILKTLKAGGTPKTGSQTGRQGSAPEGGPTVLRHMMEADDA
ncbi:MAG: NAD(P)H-dependent oxidoreductase subunit E [Rhodothalassiaceae bacterium]